MYDGAGCGNWPGASWVGTGEALALENPNHQDLHHLQETNGKTTSVGWHSQFIGPLRSQEPLRERHSVSSHHTSTSIGSEIIVFVHGWLQEDPAKLLH